MSGKEEQERLLDEAESLIQEGKYSEALDKLAQVTEESLQTKRDFLVAQAQNHRN